MKTLATAWESTPREELFDTRRKYEPGGQNSRLSPRLKGVLYVLDAHRVTLHQYTDHIEAVRLVRAAVSIDPDRRRTRQLPLLAPVYRLHRIAELRTTSCFHFDERHQAVSLRNQIDIAVTVAEPSLQHTPPVPTEPTLGHTLPYFAEFLPCRGHGAKIEQPTADAVIERACS